MESQKIRRERQFLPVCNVRAEFCFVPKCNRDIEVFPSFEYGGMWGEIRFFRGGRLRRMNVVKLSPLSMSEGDVIRQFVAEQADRLSLPLRLVLPVSEVDGGDCEIPSDEVCDGVCLI